jgi:hypothetical protein
MTKAKAKKATKKKATAKSYDGPILVLKTTKAGGEPYCNGVSDGAGGVISTDFRWPRSGSVVCADWDPAPKCGHGFHGLEFGEGDWNLLKESETPSEEWRVICVQPQDVVRLTDNGQTKIKFRQGEIVYSGNKAAAISYVMCGKEAMERSALGAKGKAVTNGDCSTAASSGYYSKAASSGYSSTAASSGDSSKAASSGYSSKAASSGDRSTADQEGKSGIATAIGTNVRAKAGENGLIILTWWDDKAERYHACVGEVGTGGIEAGVLYEVVDGKLSRVE